MKTLKTWSNRTEFKYEGSILSGISLYFGTGNKQKLEINRNQLNSLLKHFEGKTVEIGTSHTAPPSGSLGDYIKKNITQVGIASYLGPVLIYENKAVKSPVKSTQIIFN